MWNAAGPNQPTLALFWVADLNNAGAAAFAIPSRGALIGPTAVKASDIAHEIGHCMALQHCWHPDSVSAETKLADIESLRLMGYLGGMLLRSKEIVEIQKWDPSKLDPVTGKPLP